MNNLSSIEELLDFLGENKNEILSNWTVLELTLITEDKKLVSVLNSLHLSKPELAKIIVKHNYKSLKKILTRLTQGGRYESETSRTLSKLLDIYVPSSVLLKPVIFSLIGLAILVVFLINLAEKKSNSPELKTQKNEQEIPSSFHKNLMGPDILSDKELEQIKTQIFTEEVKKSKGETFNLEVKELYLEYQSMMVLNEKDLEKKSLIAENLRKFIKD